MSKNKSLTIYLMQNNLKSFKGYLKDEYQKKVSRHYIDRQKVSGVIENGIIFINEETLDKPDWVSYLNELSLAKSIKVEPKKVSRSVLFLRLKSTKKITFAITFGNGATLLDPDHIVTDFGYKIAKSLLKLNEIISIDTVSFDKKMFNTKKQSAAFLMPEKLLEYGTQNIVKNVHGIYSEFDQKFSVGGNESLNFRGNLDLLTDLEKWLIQFADLYSSGKDNLGIIEDLIPVNKKLQEILDDKLSDKILRIINKQKITKRDTRHITISPPVTFDLENFNGFFIDGLGYKKSDVSSDFQIDEFNFFERFQQQIKANHKNKIGILRKIKTDKIKRKLDTGEQPVTVCSLYKAFHYETTYHSKTYILISGKWYEIDKEFYSQLKKEINSIPLPDMTLDYIDFNSTVHSKQTIRGKQASENVYNDFFAKKNEILLLDCKDYTDPDKMTFYGFKVQSSIELCDALYFNSDKVQFIHVKRHSGGASGTSHLLNQALGSAQVFINDTEKITNYINMKIKESNDNNTYQLPELKYEEQKKEIVFAIIDKKENIKKAAGEHSKLLSLLEMITIRSQIKNLEYLGFKCYLKFIPGDTK